ncbi:MAG TPA: AMP-binding protein [Burkholderiales bacterium]|nr:AMP-binding protein [Burkholderiales bacterium]
MSGWAPRVLGEFLALQPPRAEALVTPTRRLDYGALHAAAHSVARAMHGLGLRKGDHAAILMGNDQHWLALFYGAALLGVVTVPVNTRFKAAELEFCLKQADCRAIFAAPGFRGNDYAAMLREIAPRLPLLEHKVLLGEDSWRGFAALDHGQKIAWDVRPDDLLLIQFTSGTTAYPKGVMLTHDNMLRNAWAAGERIGVKAEDRYFNCRPLFHVGGSTLSALMCLVHGACLVTLPTFEAGAALAMMEAERCTLTSGNDTIFQLLMGHADFPRRRLVLRGGWAAAGPQTLQRIIRELGAKRICAAYGLSEASPNVVMSDWRDAEALRVQGLATPLPELQLRTLDGEIQVRGWSVMRGYYNDPEATAQAFTEDGWLRTGDLGELHAGGRLRMLGRLKDVFRVGGENVAPAEVEEVLLGHPAVQSAQVVGVPDARLGEVPCAYVSLKAGHKLTEDALLAWVRERCANFRVPRYLRIVRSFEAIGMTASGKVQKNRLREQALREFKL